LGIIVAKKQASIRRARRQRQGAVIGFIVTWDVDSGDAAMCARVRRFIFGYELSAPSKTYRYPGLVDREGVRYLGQSVLFVTHDRTVETQGFLRQNGVPHVVTRATLGALMPSWA